ncbi:Uncharacterized protein HZ326_29261 [Fusarium oxysporum f. sp. albedinis]|nr:Uncharacterized protein HZ326_29261 [Fusarium oxysporum f. sp. albedinis]
MKSSEPPFLYIVFSTSQASKHKTHVCDAIIHPSKSILTSTSIPHIMDGSLSVEELTRLLREAEQRAKEERQRAEKERQRAEKELLNVGRFTLNFRIKVQN